jgi:hypothetical protein
MQIEDMPILARRQSCDAVRSDAAGIDSDRLGAARWAGNEPAHEIEMPTRGLNRRLGARAH